VIKRLFLFLMIGQLLVGSTIFPLCDFSLMQDLPRMYHAYERVVSPDEKGVLDFVGDYLLGGKTLFDHNQHDQPEKGDFMQFPHAAIFVALAHCHRIEPTAPVVTQIAASPIVHQPGNVSQYSSSLFRPPLA